MATVTSTTEQALRPEPIISEDRPLPPELWLQVDHLTTEDESPVDNIFSELRALGIEPEA